MRIIVVCGAGASSTFVAQRIRRAAAARGLSVQAAASSASGLGDALPGADVLLVGEHLTGQLTDLRERAVAASVPIAVLPAGASSAADGEAALDLALATAGRIMNHHAPELGSRTRGQGDTVNTGADTGDGGTDHG